MKYPVYPEIINAGIEWLSKKPSHWLTTKLKYFAGVNMGQSPSSSDCNDEGLGLPFLQGNAEFTDKYPIPKQYCEVAPKRCERNDLLFSVRAPVGALNVADQVYGIGRGLCAITPNKCAHPEFVWWVMHWGRVQLDAISTGSTFESVSAENVKSLQAVIPQVAEQTQIANFLDHETAKIDTLIDKQQQLIKLLKEKRQAVISHAVTKGLNPDAKMKGSGVEWLGEVPEHWGLAPLKFFCRFSGGGTPSKDKPEFWNGHIPWVSPKDMKVSRIKSTIDKITGTAVEQSSTNLLREGALLMVVRSGILQHSIPVAINEVPVTLNQDMKSIRFSKRMTAEFALNVISGNEKLLLMEWRKQGATVESIEQEYLANTVFPIPPMKEQVAINRFIGVTCEVIDQLMTKCNKAIALMKERRAALISAAVTGKIDVRNAA